MCYQSIAAAIDAGGGGDHKGRRTAVVTSLGLVDDYQKRSSSGRKLEWFALKPIDVAADTLFVNRFLDRITGLCVVSSPFVRWHICESSLVVVVFLFFFCFFVVVFVLFVCVLFVVCVLFFFCVFLDD